LGISRIEDPRTALGKELSTEANEGGSTELAEVNEEEFPLRFLRSLLVQPSLFDTRAGENPASAIGGWAE
jgi:hypothetical protein